MIHPTNQTATASTIVRFTAVMRRSRETRPCWIKSASFADGPGMKVKSIQTTFNRDEAASFSTATAIEIALQFFKTPAALEMRNGTQLTTDTERLHQEQRQLLATYNQNVREFNAAVADLLNGFNQWKSGR